MLTLDNVDADTLELPLYRFYISMLNIVCLAIFATEPLPDPDANLWLEESVWKNVFSISMTSLGVLVIGGTVGNVSLWLFTNSSSYTQYRKKMAHISEEMSYYHLPTPLQYRIRKYYGTT